MDFELVFNLNLLLNVMKMIIRLYYFGSCMDFVIDEIKVIIIVVFFGFIVFFLEVLIVEGI